jgi:hypothetical protein
MPRVTDFIGLFFSGQRRVIAGAEKPIAIPKSLSAFIADRASITQSHDKAVMAAIFFYVVSNLANNTSQIVYNTSLNC